MRLLLFLLLAIIILSLAECSAVEGFTSSAIYLLGDSTLANGKYVETNASVAERLRANGETVIELAMDGCPVRGVESQLKHVRCKPAVVVVSVGGNNILHQTNFERSHWEKALDKEFASYKRIVDKLITCSESRIILLDVYYPVDPEYQKYHPLIKYWNSMVYKYAEERDLRMRKISRSLTSSDDFVGGVEPSASGGAKIATGILKAKG